MTRLAAAWENAAMKTRRIHSRPASQGFISAQAAIVLAVIAAGGGLLAYEWHSAHAGHSKGHHSSAAKHHHGKHDAKTAATN